MARNLDLTALRAFATVAQVGGVTRAAGLLHLTQSAVSMQLKRLEDALDVRLLDRSARGVELTAAGERVLGTAQQMLALNDGLIEQLRAEEPEGELTLGVPHDIVGDLVPVILRAFAAEFPRYRLRLLSSYTTALHERLAAGEVDVILGTEDVARPGGEEIVRLPLIWVGAPGGQAWRQRPMRLAFESKCLFRRRAQQALDDARIGWEIEMTAASSRAVGATVAADLACHVALEGFVERGVEAIAHGTELPALGDMAITLYQAQTGADPVRERLVAMLREGYGALRAPRRPSLSIAATG